MQRMESTETLDDGVEGRIPFTTYVACNSCRARKVRCDGKSPCGACTRSQNSKRGSFLAQICEYSAMRPKRPRYFQGHGAQVEKVHNNEGLKVVQGGDPPLQRNLTTGSDFQTPPTTVDQTFYVSLLETVETVETMDSQVEHSNYNTKNRKNKRKRVDESDIETLTNRIDELTRAFANLKQVGVDASSKLYQNQVNSIDILQSGTQILDNPFISGNKVSSDQPLSITHLFHHFHPQSHFKSSIPVFEPTRFQDSNIPPTFPSQNLASFAQSAWPSTLPPRDLTIPLVMRAFNKCMFLSDIVYAPKYLRSLLLQSTEDGQKLFEPLVLATFIIGTYDLREAELESMKSVKVKAWDPFLPGIDGGIRKNMQEWCIQRISKFAFHPEDHGVLDEKNFLDLAKTCYLMALFLHTDGQYSRIVPWMTIGIRICIMLGLNKYSPNPPVKQCSSLKERFDHNREMFERSMLFWLFLSLEIHSSIITYGPPSIAEADITACLPLEFPQLDVPASRNTWNLSQMYPYHPEFFEFKEDLEDLEAHQLYFKILLWGERVVALLRNQQYTQDRWKKNFASHVRLERESSDFQTIHTKLQYLLRNFPSKFLKLYTRSFHTLTSIEKRDLFYYHAAYGLLNTYLAFISSIGVELSTSNSLVINFHTPFWSHEPDDVSMISAFQAAKNIFSHQDYVVIQYEQHNFINLNILGIAYFLGFRILIRDLILKRQREKNGQLVTGESPLSLEVQIRKFGNWISTFAKDFPEIGMTQIASKVQKFMDDPLIVIPNFARSSTVKGYRMLLPVQWWGELGFVRGKDTEG